MMPTLSLMDISEYFLAFLGFDTALEHACDTSLV